MMNHPPEITQKPQSLAQRLQAEKDAARIENEKTARWWTRELKECPGISKVSREGVFVTMTLSGWKVPVCISAHSTPFVQIGYSDLTGVEMVWDCSAQDPYESIRFKIGPTYPFEVGDTGLRWIMTRMLGGGYYICTGHETYIPIKKKLLLPGGPTNFVLGIRRFLENRSMLFRQESGNTGYIRFWPPIEIDPSVEVPSSLKDWAAEVRRRGEAYPRRKVPTKRTRKSSKTDNPS